MSLSSEVKTKHMTELAAYRRKLYKAPKLKSLFLELTISCNERCRHCGSSCGDIKPTDELTTAEICNFLDYCAKHINTSETRLCITGGEPLLREDFFEIMSYAKKLGFSWGMTSNGILIDDETAHRLAAAGMKTVSISIDGLPETHDWFRQRKDSCEAAMNGVRALVKRPEFAHVQVTTVVHKRSLSELSALYDILSRENLGSWRVINIEPIGRAKQQPELLLDAEDYKKLFRFIYEKRTAGGMEVTYGCSHYLGRDWEREVRRWYFLCNAGIYTASVMYNGDIGGCLDIERRPELIQGNIRKDDFMEVWQNRFRCYRDESRLSDECRRCSEAEFCAGDAFHTWNFNENKPDLCFKGILF